MEERLGKAEAALVAGEWQVALDVLLVLLPFQLSNARGVLPFQLSHVLFGGARGVLPFQLSHVLLGLGRAKLRLGLRSAEDHENTEQWLREAAKKASASRQTETEIQARCLLAELYKESGKLEQALSELSLADRQSAGVPAEQRADVCQLLKAARTLDEEFKVRVAAAEHKAKTDAAAALREYQAALKLRSDRPAVQAAHDELAASLGLQQDLPREQSPAKLEKKKKKKKRKKKERVGGVEEEDSPRDSGRSSIATVGPDIGGAAGTDSRPQTPTSPAPPRSAEPCPRHPSSPHSTCTRSLHRPKPCPTATSTAHPPTPPSDPLSPTTYQPITHPSPTHHPPIRPQSSNGDCVLKRAPRTARESSVEADASPLLYHLKRQNARLAKYLASEEAGTLDEEQQIYIGLAIKTKEETHLDFKQYFSAKWRDDLPRQVVGLYNGLGGAAYPGVAAGQAGGSSFLVYGVHEVGGASGRLFYPDDENAIPLGKDITDIMGNTKPRVMTRLCKVRFGRDICLDACFEDPERRATLREGWYAFVEVKHTRDGPARFKKTRGDSGAWALVARSDDRTLTEEELRGQGSMSELLDLFSPSFTVNALDDLEPILCAARDRIKILAINPGAEVDAKSWPALKTLFTALGRADFQLLVNFGPPASKAMEAFVAGIHASKKDCYQLSWKQLEKDGGKICSEVRNRQFCVMVDGSGAPTKRGALLRVWGKLTSQLFDAGSPGGLQLGLFVACLSQPNNLDDWRCVQMAERLHESFDGLPTPAPNDPASAPLTLLLSSEASHAFQTKLSDDGEQLGWEGCSAPPQQLALAFQRAFGSSGEEPPGYVVRGVSGDVEIPTRLLASTEPSVELLHKSSGTGAFRAHATQSEKESCLEAHRRAFLSGYTITTEALYAHDEVPSHGELGVYAPRPQMKTLKQLLERQMDRLKSSVERNVGREKTVVLEHEPSAGATTVGRVVLWELRHRFPCLLVKRTLDSSVQRALDVIFEHTLAPILLLVEGEHATDRDAEEFRKHFTKAQLLILLIKPCRRQLQESGAAHMSDALLPLKLQPLENRGFRKLYQKYAEQNLEQLGPAGIAYLKDSASRDEPTPFLWGLYSFFGDFAGIEKTAAEILSHAMNSSVRDVLMLSSYLRLKAGKCFLSSQLANYYLGELPHSEKTARLKSRLGLAQHLLVSTWSERGWAEQRGWGLTPPINQLAHVLIRQLEEASGEAAVSQVIRLLTQPDRDDAFGHLVQGALDETVVRLCRYRILDGDRHCPLIEDVFRFRRKEALDRAAHLSEKKDQAHAQLAGSPETSTEAGVSVQAEQKEQDADPAGVISAARDLEALAQASSKGRSHVFAHIARFICFSPEMADHWELVLELLGKALEVIPRAGERRPAEVDLSRTGVTDHLILSVAAHVLGSYSDKILKGDMAAQARVGDQVSVLCGKARFEQRLRDHRTCHPFMHEIDCLYKLQDFFFADICGRSSEAYFDGLRGSEGRLCSDAGERHSKLITCIRDLENLNQSNLLFGQTLRHKESRKLETVKNWLREIYRTHIQDPRHAWTKFKSADENMVWAWMAVEVFLHQEILNDKREPEMEDDDSGFDADQLGGLGDQDAMGSLSFWTTAHLIHSRLELSLAKDALGILNSAKNLLSRNRFERVMLQMKVHRWEAEQLEQTADQAVAWAGGAADEITPAFLVFALRFSLALLHQPPPPGPRTATKSPSVHADHQRQLHEQAKNRLRDSFFDLQSVIKKNRRPGRRLTGLRTPRFVVEEEAVAGRRRSFLRPLRPGDPSDSCTDVASPHTRLFGGQRVLVPRANTPGTHDYQIQSQELFDATGWELREQTGPGQRGRLDICICLTHGGPRPFERDPRAH